ncbi:MAG: hypothetical protein H6844_09150 [Alphaproteobacteria bacterium]|nr:hypothetical protein [Alphaproteobacteria bacterium]
MARLPFFRAGTEGEALVLTPFAPDASSRDRGVLGLTLDAGGAAVAAMGALEAAGFRPVGAPLVAGCHVWAEVEGLVDADAPALRAVAATPGMVDVRILGGYAVPLA